MKIYNEDKTKILKNPDMTKGYIIHDKILAKIIPAKPEIKEEFHYDYINYPSGGKDRIKVIDVPYQEATERIEEFEDIEVYIPYTEEFLEKQKLMDELSEINIWFSWYDNQIKQYQRCQRKGTEFDKDIDSLDDEADIKQIRIREINTRLEELKEVKI